MSKKVIVLADNSYTIRRIVELSFSEIENIDVRSFENGSGIKEKLLQLNPSVVIVDIKLPEVNGYDVCRFINETPTLNRSRVFLMKGSFEPVDNEMIKNLKYEDIITKPFDSNALVSAVMKIVTQEEQGLVTGLADEGPSTFPEDFPEIETGAAESEDISFSDIRGEMDVPRAPDRQAARNQAVEREEILPSEEITQGTQPVKDSLMPQETEEPLKNPFEEEPPFEEINVAPRQEAKPMQIEYEKEPPSVSSAAPGAKDASDEFHERFLEIANEDTSEDLLKSPLEETALVEHDDLQFPADQKVAHPLEAEEKFSLEFEKTDMGSPAQTMYAGQGGIDLLASSPKPQKEKGLDAMAEKALDKERSGEKTRPEGLSPQDELARLAGMAKKEAKVEPQPQPAPATPQTIELNGKLEEKLGQTIKELLWEIVPPLAEKIIKEEIDKIKSDLSSDSL
jgi:DNA-binding response OmpR family regulator